MSKEDEYDYLFKGTTTLCRLVWIVRQSSPEFSLGGCRFHAFPYMPLQREFSATCGQTLTRSRG